MKLFCCALLLLFTCCTTLAQVADTIAAALTLPGASITGVVADSSALPLPGTVVTLFEKLSGIRVRSALANDQGTFTFENIAYGSYFITVSHVEYVGFTSVGFNLTKGTALRLSIKLQRNAKELAQVVVKAGNAVIQQKSDMTVVNVDDMLRKEAVNALEIIRLAPGVLVSDNEDELSLAGKNNVTVMLNGKQVKLTGRDLLKLLKSISAASVVQLEVISNPSSRYDVKGNTGILNIRTKKNEDAGITGNGNAETSQGKNNMGDLSGSLAYGAKKLNLNAYVAYHYGKYSTGQEEVRSVSRNGNKVPLSKNSRSVESWSDPVLRLQGDYYLGPRHTLGALLEVENSHNKETYNSTTRIPLPSNYDSAFTGKNYYPYQRKWNTYNLNYRYADPQSNELNVDLDRSYYNKQEKRLLTNAVSSAGNYLKTLADAYMNVSTIFDIVTLKGDYTRSFARSNLKLEAGFKLSFVETSNVFLAGNQDSGVVKMDSNLTNKFNYREKVQAVYANMGKTYKKWSFQAGFRLERSAVKGVSTDIKGAATAKPDSVYYNLMPSAFVNYAASQHHAFRLSFTQQIRRPDYESLQPFNYQLDLFSFYVGNPGLRVQSDYNTELSYTYRNKTNFTASYNYTRNYFTTVNYLVGPVLYETVQNTGTAKDLTFSINQPLRMAKWWTGNNKATLFYNHFRGQVYDGFLDAGLWSFTAYTSQRFVLPGQYIVQLTGRYNAPSRQLIYQVSGNASAGLSVSRKLFHDKSMLRIGISDIFLQQKRDVTADFSSIHYVQHNTWESRRGFLEFSYKFGSAKIKGIRDRQTGNSTEKQRAGK